MISKNLFFRQMKQDFKKRIWFPILIFIAYFLFLEVALLAGMETVQRSPKAHPYGVYVYVRDYFFGSNELLMTAVVCITAFVGAISGFSYLHSRVQLDTYHSLPVSRTQLFWSRYLSGILQFFIPFLLHVLICAGIASGRGAFGADTAVSMLSFIGLELIIFILAYSSSVLAVELTGNIIVSILGTGALFCYSMVIDVLIYTLFYRFYDTYVAYGRWENTLLSQKIWCFSPLSMLVKLYSRPVSVTMEDAGKFFKYNESYLWVLAAAAVVYSLAAYAVYVKRPSEAAGKSIAFRAAEPVIKTMIVLPAAFFIGIFFAEISVSSSDKWFLFGLVFGFVLCCVLMEIIFRMDIRGALKHKKQFLFNAACTALIFVVIRYDVTGYDTYVPADTQLQSCAVSINELMPMSQNIRLNETNLHFMGSNEYRLWNMEIQGNQSVMELARKAAREQLKVRKFDYYEGIENSPEYMEAVSRQDGYRGIVFCFNLLNGRKVYRRYIVDIADADTLRLVSDIFNDDMYKLGSVPLFNDGWKVNFDKVRCRSDFRAVEINLTPDMQSDLVSVYQSEYMDLTLDTVMHTIPAGMIDFVVQDGDQGLTSYCGDLLVYPQFTKTLALLKEYGFDMEEKPTVEDVESVSVRKMESASEKYYARRGYYSALTGLNDMVSYTELGEFVKYTDKEQIQQILDSVVTEGYVWNVSEYADIFDNLYAVNINFNENDTDYYYYYYYYSYRFVKGKVPGFIE